MSNPTLPADGTVVATETVGAAEAQIIRLDAGVGTARVPVTAGAGLPVTVTNPSGALTDAQLRAAPVPVSIPGSIPVTGAFYQATQPVSASSLPLPVGAATQTTLAALAAGMGAPADTAATDDTGSFSLLAFVKRMLAKIPASVNTVPDNTAPGQPVRMIGQDITVARFAGTGSGLLSPQMVQIATPGSGITVSQAAGSLLVAAGTVANSSWLARSANPVRGAWRTNAKVQLSQRIANNNFALVMGDLVAANASVNIVNATTIDVTVPAHGFDATNVGQFMFVGGVAAALCPEGRYAIASIPDANTIRVTVAGWPASGTTTATLFGRHHAKVLYNGTTATAALWATQASGWANADATLALNTSASPGHLLTIDQEGRRMYVSDALSASSATPNHVNRGSSEENIPDDNLDIYLFVWVYNGASAPATSTTLNLGFWSIEKYANVPVQIQGVAPQGASAPLPVLVGGTAAVSGTVTANLGTAVLQAGTAAIGGVARIARSITGGSSFLKFIAVASTNTGFMKASAGNVLSWSFTNNAAYAVFVKFYNKASAPTLASDVPVLVIQIPAGGIASFPEGSGFFFSTGIAYAATKLLADTDTTVLVAGDVVGFIQYA